MILKNYEVSKPNETETTERDDHIPSGFIESQTHHLPPTPNNPSSLDGAKQNLRHIAKHLGLKGFVENDKVRRNNVILYEDGGGWSPTFKVINNTYIDPSCQIVFETKTAFLEHWFTVHPEEVISNLNDHLEFKDFLVCSGGGHYEMNARKSFLTDSKLYPHYIRQVIMATGFTSEQARYQTTSNDNHK